jgi:hypothetical protein
MNEQDELGTWLVDYLESDDTLMAMLNGGVNAEVRPISTSASPFVRLDYLDGDDLMVIGLHRIWLAATYHVRGVLQWRGSDKPDREEINAIGARIDELLHDNEATTATLHVASFREEPTPTPATTEADGSLWLQSGGIYRFLAHAV